MKSCKKLIACVLTVMMLISSVSVCALAAPIKYGLTADLIESVSVNAYVMENVEGEMTDGRFIYDYSPNCYITVELTNGDLAYGYGDRVTYEMVHTPVTYSDTQATAPWSPGDHTATLTILGKSFDFTVTVMGAMDDDEFKTENGFEYTVWEGNATITDCMLTDEVLVIPSTLGGYPVTQVAYLGDELSHIKKIVFPDSVTYIEGYALTVHNELTSLEELEFGPSVALDMLTLGDLPALKSITVSAENKLYESVDGILYNEGMTAIVVYPAAKTGTYTVPETLTEWSTVPVSVDAVFGTTDYYTTENGLTYSRMEGMLVHVRKSLKGAITVKDGVTHIGELAFADRDGITAVTLPDSVVDIAYGGFIGCDALASVNAPTSLVSIGDSAFQNCTSLSFTPGDGVTSIGDYAFSGSAVASVTYPDSLLSIGDYAYSKTPVTKVTVPAVDSIGYGVFANSKVTAFDVASGVTSIPRGMFKNTQMTSAVIPEGVLYIEYDAFKNSAVTTLDLGTVVGIRNDAFSGTDIVDLVIPDSVTAIGDAFNDCDSLKSIKIGSGLTSLNSTFCRCDALTEVTIPANITQLYDTFSYCKNLKKVKFEGVVSVGESTFIGCDMTEADLTNMSGAVGRFAFARVGAVGINIPATVTELTYASFAEADSLAYVSIPTSVQGIHPYAFDGCDSINHVYYAGTEAQWNALASGRADDKLTAATKHYGTGAQVTKTPVDATCTAGAGINYVCGLCNAVITKEVTGEPTGHKFEDYVSDDNATTQKDGTKTAKCEWCDATDTVTDAGTKLKMQDSSTVFTDVKPDKWYSDAVDYAYSNGFISGTSKDEFGLNTSLTRGMFITILARIAGVDTSGAANDAATTKFVDVKAGRYYANAVKWGYDNGIVNGTSDTTFEPNTNITREQLCVMLLNFSEATGIELTKVEDEITFADAGSISKWAKKAVKACQMADIVSGYNEGGKVLFKPKATATRAEAAQILYVFHMDFFSVQE